MEGDVNSGQRNCGKPAFELNMSLRLLLILCTLERRRNNIPEHLFDFLYAEGFRQLEESKHLVLR
jgi:hypothetical protein